MSVNGAHISVGFLRVLREVGTAIARLEFAGAAERGDANPRSMIAVRTLAVGAARALVCVFTGRAVWPAAVSVCLVQVDAVVEARWELAGGAADRPVCGGGIAGRAGFASDDGLGLSGGGWRLV